MNSMMTLNDVCEFIVDTKHKTPKFTTEGYPCIRTPNIGRGYFILDGAKCVSEESYLEWTERATPKEKDLIFAREAPVGNIAIIPANLKVCHGQRTVLIRPDNMKVDAHYLMFLLLGDEIQNRILSMASGATVAHLNMSDIRALELPLLPSIENQKKIASILSTYYDLIENNNRRIAILEEMARSLYKEWFVKFRFPGHEEVKMVDSELGQMPEGWEIHKVNDLFLLNIGKTPPRNEAQWFTYNQGLQWVSIRDMGNNQIFLLNTAENLTDDAIEKFNFRIVPSDTVIMSFKLTVGKVSITTENMVTNEAIAHFNIKNNAILCKEYVYFYLQNFMFQTLGNTSSIGNAINSQVVKSMPFLLPDQHLIKKYERYITPHFKQILKLLKSNQNLKTQRDMLLPKLISGKIAVNQEII